MPRRCGGTGALTIGLARPRSGKQAVLPLLTCTNPISGEPPIRGSCSYSVSCPQLTQRMCHPCSWAGNRRIGAPWSADGGLMFLGSRSPPLLGRRRSPGGSPGGSSGSSTSGGAAAGTARSGAHRAAVPHRRLLRTGSGLPRAPDLVTFSRPGHERNGAVLEFYPTLPRLSAGSSDARRAATAGTAAPPPTPQVIRLPVGLNRVRASRSG